MKMKKLFAGLVATSMVAAMGTSAMAATLTETTNGTTASVAALPETTGQVTVIVAKIDTKSIVVDEETGVASVANPTIDDTTIIYIDQDAYAAGMFQDMGLKDVLEAGESYIIRVGGEQITSIHEEIYTVVSDVPPGREIQLGECDGKTAAVDGGDALAVLRHFAGTTPLTGDNLIAAECDGKTAAIDGGDALAILRHFAGTAPLGKVTVTD